MRRTDRRTVDKDSPVEVVDLFLQFNGMGIAARFRHESRFVTSLISPEHQHICNTQELQVKQNIFRIFPRKAAAQHVRHHGNAVTLLDGCCHGYRSRTAAQTLAFVKSVTQFLIHIFTAVSRNVDIFGIKFFQFINISIKTLDTCPLQRRKEFKRESGLL